MSRNRKRLVQLPLRGGRKMITLHHQKGPSFVPQGVKMSAFKRIFLFIAVNLLVMFTLSLVLNLFGVRPYLGRYGLDYQSLMIFCLIWGFGGAFISLALSRVMAKWLMGVKVIDPATHDQNGRELVQTVHRLARAAGLT